MQTIEYYLDRRLAGLEESGDTTRAAVDRLILQRTGTHNFVVWCKSGTKTGEFDTVEDAFHLHGFETTQERIDFFAANHKVIEPFFMHQAKKERRCVTDSIIAKRIDKYIWKAPLWTDVLDTLNDAEITDIFFDNNTGHYKYKWLVDNFMGWYLLNMRADIKFCVVNGYTALEEAEAAKNQ